MPGRSRATTPDARSLSWTTNGNAAAATLATKSGSPTASANDSGSSVTAAPSMAVGSSVSSDGSFAGRSAVGAGGVGVPDPAGCVLETAADGAG